MTTTSDTSMSDLQALVNAVRIDGSVSSETVDEIADTLRAKLNVCVDDQGLYRDMAELFISRCSLKNPAKENQPCNSEQNKLEKSPSMKKDEKCDDISQVVPNCSASPTTPAPDRDQAMQTQEIGRNRGRSPARTEAAFRSPLRIFSRRPPTPDRARKKTENIRVREKASPLRARENTSPKKRSLSPFARIFRRSSKTQEDQPDPTVGSGKASTPSVSTNKAPSRPPSGRRSPIPFSPEPMCVSPLDSSNYTSHAESEAKSCAAPFAAPNFSEEEGSTTNSKSEISVGSENDRGLQSFNEATVRGSALDPDFSCGVFPPLVDKEGNVEIHSVKHTPVAETVNPAPSFPPQSFTNSSDLQPSFQHSARERKDQKDSNEPGEKDSAETSCKDTLHEQQETQSKDDEDETTTPHTVSHDKSTKASQFNSVEHRPSKNNKPDIAGIGQPQVNNFKFDTESSVIEESSPKKHPRQISEDLPATEQATYNSMSTSNHNETSATYENHKSETTSSTRSTFNFPSRANVAEQCCAATEKNENKKANIDGLDPPISSIDGTTQDQKTPKFPVPEECGLFQVDLKTKPGIRKKYQSKRSVGRRNKVQATAVPSTESAKNHKDSKSAFSSSFPNASDNHKDRNSNFQHAESEVSPMETDDETMSTGDGNVRAETTNVPQFSVGVACGSPRRRRTAARTRTARNQQTRLPDVSSSKTPQSSESNKKMEFCKENAENGRDRFAQVNSSSAHIDRSKALLRIRSIRESARSFYLAGDYHSSVSSYTGAVAILSEECSNDSTNDILAVILSNRAAGLLMLGAFEAAVLDCETALKILAKTPYTGNPLSHDDGPVLKAKLYTRMARALLKIGDWSSSIKAFNDAIETARFALQICRQLHLKEEFERDNDILRQVVTDAELGKADALRFSEVSRKISSSHLPSTKWTSSERRACVELLGHINIALSTASGSNSLHEKKISLLAQLRRWREVAGHCERVACVKVRFDGLFTGDMTEKFPFPGVPPAKILTTNFFGDSNDEDYKSAELKLNSKAASEAVLRLPQSMLPVYLRALRLEERYPVAEAAIQALEAYLKARSHKYINLAEQFSWLQIEKSKLNQTKNGRERGDELFRAGQFDQAAAQYQSCISIDAGRVDASNTAGGRLHAVLHCNRAACLMAVKRFHDAVTECTSALRIHSRYMKAMLRRARCYSRLERFEESVVEYKRWIELVEEARMSPNSSAVFVTPCLFDGPRDVSDDDTKQVRKELEEVSKLKMKKENAAKEEARFRYERQKFQHHAFSDAQRRRENFFNNNSRRWDTFAGKSPRRSKNANSDTNNNRSDFGGRQSQRNGYDFRGRQSQNDGNNEYSSSNNQNKGGSFVSDPVTDHYRVLSVSVNATASEIKKAYRKMALKYHPDKNREVNAADTFRRVKLAYETLNNDTSRRQYDMERLRNSRNF